MASTPDLSELDVIHVHRNFPFNGSCFDCGEPITFDQYEDNCGLCDDCNREGFYTWAK